MNKLFFQILFAISIFCIQTISADTNKNEVVIIANRLKAPEIPLARSKLYTFQALGLPKSPVLIEFCKINKEVIHRIGFLDEHGILIDEEKKKITYDLSNFGYGEILHIIMQPCNLKGCPLDSNTKGALSFAPNPLEARDDKGHLFEITCKDPKGNMFDGKLSGFQPNEKLEIISRSCHEKMHLNVNVDEYGQLELGHLPSVIGKQEGPFSLTIVTKDTNLSLQHFWGKLAFINGPKYQELKKEFASFFDNKGL
jgi:hypothetical protein